MSQSEKDSPSLVPFMCQHEHSLSFQELVRQLELTDQPLSVSTIRYVLENLSFTSDEINGLVEFSEDTYFRKQLFKNDQCELLMMSWLNGQRSKIHDHLHTSCGVKVLMGQATETLFMRADNQHIYATGSDVHPQGSVTASMDSDIHQISNLQSDNQRLITLHLYSPPLKKFRFYHLETGKQDWFDSESMDAWIYEI
ncbi:cysteine dioxygenase family protein [Vibrio profundum]|uniref:cysteine dioxygenase n=1 Tax=Vibrio profundum TaxID=2910247 RepID=UPI003D0C6101